MDEIDIPQYFLCPISLQIMKDPVTTVTGITYDRDSIEQWLSTAEASSAAAVCPVTKLPLSKSAGLTPNHMLRRLIQAWCVANVKSGIDRIPTPKSPLHRSAVIKLIRGAGSRRSRAENLEALRKLEELAGDDGGKNQQCMAEAGTGKSMISYVMRCFDDGDFAGVDRALRILRLTWSPTAENKQIVEEKNPQFLQSILWILNGRLENSAKADALVVLKNAIEVASSVFLEKLKPSFFKEMVRILRTQTAARAVLKILIRTCPAGRNRTKIIETGAVFELIEMELGSPETKTTELIFCLLAQLCSCADGRQQFLQHAGGVGLVAKRLLRVSPTTNDRAMRIYESIARFSATRAVVAEMLTVGGVTKLCMILQADCDVYLKKKAREILKLHSKAWSNSPCIQLYLLTRYSKT
ncbi:E3 ubiquitin-protein ligase PUB24-like [Salvia miltiorrhiza]|uniref:E3 ubiquitin-protein ligase PUB24-like n=1 Tax=Salvia miltiorrhiza TaxID=226208 RepID=UPI0025ABFB9E|nr:E3 ubiquitin-protein ligase PUB24-like [Salvia miltiorrhiza]